MFNFRFLPHSTLALSAMCLLVLLAPSVIHAAEITPKQADTVKVPAANPFFSTKKNRLANPNASLVELAFKFGKNPSAEKTRQVYAEYCQQGRDGNANSLFALGWMHASGKGRPINLAVAKSFYHMAADRNNQLAINALQKLPPDTAMELPLCMLPDPEAFTLSRLPSHRAVISTLQAQYHAQVQAEELAKLEVLAKQNANAERAERLFRRQRSIYRVAKKIGRRYGIDPKLVMSFIAIESGFDRYATSVKNAQGLMQLIPATAKRFGVYDAYNAQQNIKGGVRYLRWLLAYYQGNIQLVAAAYNAGEGAVDRYRGVPPYRETQNYVKKIAKLYGKTTHPYRQRFVNPSRIVHLHDTHPM